MGTVIEVQFRKRKKYRPRAKPAKVAVHVRMDQEHLAQLNELAERSGMSTAEYVRRLAHIAVTENVLLSKSNAA
ncbi:plasmid mobilization protein [Pseudoxanthomonas mexicana]